MKREVRQRLEDIRLAIAEVEEFTRAKAYGEYLSDSMLRSAVLWQFVRICESVRQIARDDDDLETALQIAGYREIINFRTLLIHRFHLVEHDRIWQYIHEDLPTLRADVEALLAASED